MSKSDKRLTDTTHEFETLELAAGKVDERSTVSLRAQAPNLSASAAFTAKMTIGNSVWPMAASLRRFFDKISLLVFSAVSPSTSHDDSWQLRLHRGSDTATAGTRMFPFPQSQKNTSSRNYITLSIHSITPHIPIEVSIVTIPSLHIQARHHLSSRWLASSRYTAYTARLR